MPPSVADFEELDLTAYQIGPITRRPEQLRHRFGAGYGVKINVGAETRLWGWTLEQTVLPDSMTLETVGGMSTFDYYDDFFDRHTSGDSDVFQIEFNGKKYHASVADPEWSGEQLTSDLFMGNEIVLEQRRVAGMYYRSDGSIFDPSFVTTGVWGWYQGDAYTGAGPYTWTDQPAGHGNDLTSSGDVLPVADVINDLGVMRLNSVAATGFFNTSKDPSISEAFFLMKVREATFSTYQGILTADVVNANPGGGGLLIGSNGQTKLEDLSFGGIYSYRKDGVLLTEATQNAPMNAFAVIHGRWTTPIPVTNLQIGKDRDIAARYLKADIVEVVLCDALLSAADSADMDGYLMRRGGLT